MEPVKCVCGDELQRNYDQRFGDHDDSWRIKCDACGRTGPWAKSLADAGVAWNTMQRALKQYKALMALGKKWSDASHRVSALLPDVSELPRNTHFPKGSSEWQLLQDHSDATDDFEDAGSVMLEAIQGILLATQED